MVCWGETDSYQSWLSFWGLANDQIIRAARAVGVEWRRVDDTITELLQPPWLEEFGCGLLEGDFPELAPDTLDHQPS